jgi:hypothetical protein
MIGCGELGVGHLYFYAQSLNLNVILTSTTRLLYNIVSIVLTFLYGGLNLSESSRLVGSLSIYQGLGLSATPSPPHTDH